MSSMIIINIINPQRELNKHLFEIYMYKNYEFVALYKNHAILCDLQT